MKQVKCIKWRRRQVGVGAQAVRGCFYAWFTRGAGNRVQESVADLDSEYRLRKKRETGAGRIEAASSTQGGAKPQKAEVLRTVIAHRQVQRKYTPQQGARRRTGRIQPRL